MAADHDHTASKTHPRKPETHGGKRPRINSAYTPYGVSALGAIGSGTFLGGAGGGPGQPQSIGTSGGVSNGWVAPTGAGTGASAHLSPDQFGGSGSSGGVDMGVDPSGAGDAGIAGPSAGIMSAGLG